MRTLGWIAMNGFRESVRDKVLYNLVAFAILLMGTSYLLGQLTANGSPPQSSCATLLFQGGHCLATMTDLWGGFELLHRRLILLQADVHHPQVIVRFDVRRLALHDLLEQVDGLWEFLCLFVQERQLILGFGKIGTGLQGLGEGVLGSGLVALLRLQHAKVERCIGVGGLQRQHAGIGRYRLFAIALGIIQHGQAEVRFDVVGLLRHDRPIGLDSLLGLFLTLSQDAQTQQRVDVLWLLRGGALLASLLSSLPAWRLIDPLPVLSRVDDEEDADEDQDAFVSFTPANPPFPVAQENA